MPAKSIKQQRFMGMVRAAQKGEGAASPEVAKVAASMKKKDAKDFASTKHKGLPMKKEEYDLEEGMTLKDFKANRRKNKRKEASTDAKKRGHVGKEWYNSGQTYSPDEAKSGRAKMDDEERSTRKRSAMDPDAEDSDYSADKTKNPKKIRKQKAMGESMINEEDYDRMKDRRMERGGVDGNTRYSNYKPARKLSNKELGVSGQTAYQKQHAGKSALDIVKASIRAKHGEGALIDTKKKTKSEGYAPGDVDQKVGAVTAIPKKEQEAAKERLLKKAAAKRAALKKESTFAGNYEGPLYAPHPDLVAEMPYQVYGSTDGKKEKKIGKPVKSKKYADARASELADTHKKTGGKYRSEYTEETIVERGDFWHPDPEKDKKLGGPGANQRAREDRADAAKPKKDYSKTTKPGESYMDYAKRKQSERSSSSSKPKYSPEIQKRLDAARARKKEGIVSKIARKVGLKKEEVITFKEFIAEGNRTGRMMQKSKTQVTGHISADRGDDEKKNREGRKTLEKDLKKHGIGHKKGVGEYKYGSGETGREVSYQTSKPEKMSKRRFGKVMRRMGRKHGQESVITKDADKSAKLHYTEKGSKSKSDSIGKTKAGKHPEGYGETSGTKVRGGKLPKKTTKGAYHYG